MAGTDAIRDQNRVPVALGVSSADATATLPFKINSTTGGLIVDAGGTEGIITGSGTAGQVAYFDDTQSITSSPYFKFTGTIVTVGTGTSTFTAGGATGGIIATQAGGNTYYTAYTAQNLTAGTTASTDYILGNDIATDTTNYGDLGLNSSTNADPLYTAMSAGGLYLYNQSGNVHIGTASAKYISFFTGGTLAANEKMRITSAGNIGIGTGAPGKILEIKDTVNTNTAQLKLSDLSTSVSKGYAGNFANVFYLTSGGTYAGGWVGDNASKPISSISLDSSTSGGSIINLGTAAADNTAPSTRMSIIGNGNVGIGTTAPTHSLTFPSTSTGIALYNTADQTTNYERVVQFWSSNVYLIQPELGGTGTGRSIQLGATVNGNTILVRAGQSASGGITYTAGQSGGSVTGHAFNVGANSTTSSTAVGMSIVTSYNQLSGTAANTDLLISRTETALGSGAQRLIDAQVASVSKFSVSNAGLITATGSLAIVSGNVTIAAGGNFQWNNRSIMQSPSDGVITLTNAASTDFGRVQFGGTTSSFPALKRNGTGLEAKLADDSLYTSLRVAQLYAGNEIRILSTLYITSPSDGVMLLQNNAGADFGRVQFGGTTSSFPSLKRNATGIDFRLADDSAYAPITTGNATIGSVGSAFLLSVNNAQYGAAAVSLRMLSTGTNVGIAQLNSSGTLVFGIQDKGIIGVVNAINTAGWGVPAIYGSGRSTGQTAAVASVAAYTVGAADGSFIVSGNVNITTSSAEAFNLQVTYTDETNTSRTLNLPLAVLGGTTVSAVNFSNGAVPYSGMPVQIRCKASTAITIKTAGTFTGATYNVEGSISQVS